MGPEAGLWELRLGGVLLRSRSVGREDDHANAGVGAVVDVAALFCGGSAQALVDGPESPSADREGTTLLDALNEDDDDELVMGSSLFARRRLTARRAGRGVRGKLVSWVGLTSWVALPWRWMMKPTSVARSFRVALLRSFSRVG